MATWVKSAVDAAKARAVPTPVATSKKGGSSLTLVYPRAAASTSDGFAGNAPALVQRATWNGRMTFVTHFGLVTPMVRRGRTSTSTAATTLPRAARCHGETARLAA